MSQFLSNKYLRYRGLDQTPGRFIDTDLPCSRCNYNLRGLLNTKRCPECGTPIKVPEPARISLLSDAPLSDIRRLALGLWLSIGCIVALPLTIVFSAGFAQRVGAGGLNTVTSSVTVLSVLWIASVWCMTPTLETPEGERHGFTHKSRTRLVARWSQFGWLLALAMISLLPGIGLASGLAVLAALCIGLGGLVALSLTLGRLADWACDEPAGGMLNVTVWLLPLATGILLLGPIFPAARFLVCLAMATWIGALATFGLALLSLAMSATWSLKHANIRLNKEEELRRRTTHPPLPPLPSDEPIQLSLPGDPLPDFGLVEGPPGREHVTDTSLDDITRDVACTECGYNLRGLKAYGRCPECGERIASA